MKRHLNLIPISLRRRQLIYRQTRHWALVCGCALVLGGMLVHRYHAKTLSISQQVARLEQDTKSVRAIARKSTQTRSEIELQRQKEQWLRSLEQAEVPLIVLAAIHQSMAKLGGQVQLDRFQFQRLNIVEQSPTPNASQPIVPTPLSVDNRIDLSGLSIDDAAVSALITELEASGLFADVELVSLQSQGALKRQFQVQCHLQGQFEHFEALARKFDKNKNPIPSPIAEDATQNEFRQSAADPFLDSR